MILLIQNLMIGVEDAIDCLMMLYPCLGWGARILQLILVRNRIGVLLGGMLLGRGLLRVLGARICGGGILCNLLFLFSLIRLLFLLSSTIYFYSLFSTICSLYLLLFSIGQHPQFPYLLENHPNCPWIIQCSSYRHN